MGDLLREVHYNRETGFRSIDETLRQARVLTMPGPPEPSGSGSPI